ncbi:MAG: hypothetical protein AAF696_26075 [Bacteroidota bacterium]
MAKKDLSHAKGLDALFNSAPSISRPEPIAKRTLAKKKAKAPAKTPPKKEVEAEVLPEDKFVEEVLEEIKEEEVPKVQAKPRKKQSANKEQMFSVNLEGVRKRKIEYTGIRLKKDLFERLESIANREKLKSTNSLIALVLEAYCDGYEA